MEWNNHFALNNWLRLDADFTWTHARYFNMNNNGEMGNFIANAVSKVASVGLTAENVGPWSGDIKLRYIRKYPLSQDGTLVGPSAFVVNARVQRQINAWAAISLDAINVLDRKYYDIAYDHDYQLTRSSSVVLNGVTVHPGEPREFHLTLRLRF